MKSIEANAISIKQYLSEKGIQRAKDREYYGMYYSPFRVDHNVSLKVDYNQNVWHDFGTGEDGGLIDLVMKMQNSTFYEVITMLEKEQENFSSFSFHGNQNHFPAGTLNPEPAISIQKIQPINNPALIYYLKERQINVKIARIHCSEVHYSMNDKTYFAVGVQNDLGGYELRNKYFKGCTSKDITSIKRNNDHCLLFEGFMDYLSFLTLKKLQKSSVNVIVMNSMANLPKVKNTLESYKSISAFLDNDQAGKRAVQKLESICKDVIDHSFFYATQRLKRIPVSCLPQL